MKKGGVLVGDRVLLCTLQGVIPPLLSTVGTFPLTSAGVVSDCLFPPTLRWAVVDSDILDCIVLEVRMCWSPMGFISPPRLVSADPLGGFGPLSSDTTELGNVPKARL